MTATLRMRVALYVALGCTGCASLAGLEPFQLELVAPNLDGTEAGTVADGPLSIVDAGDGSSIAPVDGPFCVTSDTTIYTHGRTGNDQSGDGSCQRPFKTITRALTTLRAGDKLRWTVRVGGTSDSPVVYSKEEGETFPIVLDSTGWVVQGQSREGVIVRGTDPQAGGASAAIEIGGRQNELQNLVVESPSGAGLHVRKGANAATMNGVTVRGCEGHGLAVEGNLIVLRSLVTENGLGIFFGVTGGATLTIEASEVSKNESNGVFVWGDTYYESRNSKYLRNGGTGLVTIHNAGLSSTDDVVSDNGRDGYNLGNADANGVNATILRAQITLNGGHGISIDQSPRGPMRVRDTLITGNLGAAVSLSNRALVGIDLGTLASPGNNTFGSAASPNKCGVLNAGPTNVSAVGNRWSTCPTPAPSTTCDKGSDVVRTGTGTTDVSSCL